MNNLSLEQELEIKEFIYNIECGGKPTYLIKNIITDLVVARDASHDKVRECIKVLNMGPRSEHTIYAIGKTYCPCWQCAFVRAKNKLLKN